MRFGAASAAALCLCLAGCAVVPEPLTESQISDYAEDKQSRVVADQEPLAGPLSLSEAMARALKYNLDKEVEVMQVMLSDRQLRVAHYSKLPQVVSDWGYADRNNYSGGSSVRLLGPTSIGEESLTSSTSSERDVQSADIRFSWNILDFGLSWVRAKQAADRVLIAEESRRRVINRILENVRTAYWRAVSATRLTIRMQALESRVRRALDDTEALIAKGDSSPLTALTYERELVEIQRELRKLDGELSSAKGQLAALINVDPGSAYEVAVPRSLVMLGSPGLSPEEMVSTALRNRSELREVAYQQRINAHEAEAALLEMLPGVSLDAAPNWNSNQFLFNNHWVAWGAQASWNLIKVFSYPDRVAEIDAEDDLLDTRALAVTMAIMTQVHLSRARLYHARRDYESAAHYYDVQARILEQIRSALAAGKVSEQTAIREEMNTLVATVKRDMAYAEMQSAAAALIASMGRTPYDDLDYHSLSVAELKGSISSGGVVALQ
ncbi:MAG: TolC family protein [Hyphomicrobiaceae bacterium]